MTIDQIGRVLSPSWSKEALIRMVREVGLGETERRFAWLFGIDKVEAAGLVYALLYDSCIDAAGDRGAYPFWSNS